MAGGPTFTFGDQPALPAPGVSRADRIRATARARYGAAGNVSERLAVAVDYLRAAAAEAGRSGVDADPAITDTTRAAIAAGDAVTDAIAGRAS